MPAPGTKLGPYEVVGPLGAGGMGEVFRARDPRLARDVAIKALPAAFAQDAERLARFEREAKLLASLNHPNVAGIHGVEEADGTRYLVLEFVDGETLDAHLQRGRLPLAEVLDIARQVAAGVEAAHEAGVVHRDLKPGNVMLTAAGGVKVLDFGLAKSGAKSGAASSDPKLSASPTMTYHATEAGMILGTAAYMSPEQARGKAVDRRTDIWSFGCVLYEMLAGKRAYDGETVSDMVARILEREPDWSALPAALPPRLVALLKRCLVKDAKQRVRDIGDVRLELEAIAAGDGGAPAASSEVAPPRGGTPAWVLALGAAALLALGAFAALRLAPSPDGGAVAATLLAPPGVAFGGMNTDMVLSPDGRLVAFVASDTVAGARLWVRGLDRENSRPLAGTNDAEHPFWSPDSRAVGFFAGGKLKTIDLATGTVRVLAPATLPRGGAWGRGVILYQPQSLGPLWSVPETGGTPSVATVLDSAAGERGHRFPQFLPDGKHFVVTSLGNGENRALLGALGERKTRELFPVTAAAGAAFAGPDWLIAPRNGVVQAQRLDLRSFQMHGPAVEIPGVRTFSPLANGSPIVSASANGMLLQRSTYDAPQRLVLVDRQGHAVRDLTTPAGTMSSGSIAPDGRRGAFECMAVGASVSSLWLVDLERGDAQPLDPSRQGAAPVFSPDGTTIAFTSDEERGRQNLWALRPDRSGSAHRVRQMEGYFQTCVSWAPDGGGVLLRTQGTTTRQDLVFVSLADSSVRIVCGTEANEPVGAISPDGRSLAYVTDESGRNEVRVSRFPEAQGAAAVVSRGAYCNPNAASRIGLPVWRRDGRELLYVAADGRTLMVVDVTPGDPPRFGEPRPLFRLGSAVADMAASADLSRFVLSITIEEEGRSAAALVTNWPRLLETAK